MKKYFYAILAAAAVISACAKVDELEDTKIPVDAAKTAFSGTIIQPNGLANTKVYAVDGTLDKHGDGQTNLYWNKNDEILVTPTGTDDKKYFRADKAGAEVYFGFDEEKHYLEEISSWLIANDHNGYTAYYPVEYWGDDFWESAWLKECLNGEEASLEKMPLRAQIENVNPVGGGHTYRPLCFSSPFAILKIVMPIDMKGDKMVVNATPNTAAAAASVYSVEITNLDALKEKASDSKTYEIYVPIKPTTEEWGFHNNTGYSKLEFEVYNGDYLDPWATMSTYEHNEGDIFVDANKIYYFDFRQTHTINTSSEQVIDISVNDKNVNYLVNVPANMETLTLNAMTENSAPAAIFVNVRDNKVDKLIINAPYSHVEVFNGEATNVTSKTSNSTFVAKSDFTVETLKVLKGNVVVEGTKEDDYSTIANIKKIIIPNDAKGQIVIDVKGVDPSNALDNKRVQIDNQRDNGTVIMVVGERINNPGFEKVEGSKDVQQVAGAVAKIGDAEYYTLASAIEGVKNDETITLVRDVDQAFGISVPAGSKTFTVDFGGYTYKVEKPGAGSANTKTQAFQLNKGNTITFKNGTIECTTANKNFTWQSGDDIKGVAMIIQNYANLTLEDMTIDATNIAQNGNDANVRYAVSTNHGSTEFKGNTTIITVGNDIAFDSCDSKKPEDEESYPGKPTVIWNSTGAFNDSFELSGGNFTVNQDIKLKRPIQTGANTFTLTVNANITPVSEGWEKVKGDGKDALIIVNRGGDLTINGVGKISSNNNTVAHSAVKMIRNVDEGADGDYAKLTVGGNVTIEGYYYGIVGNGSRKNTEITINGGIVRQTKSNDGAGIYNPQQGSLTINGGFIEGAVGIYVKAGDVKTSTTGGNIKGVGVKADFSHNGSGINNTGDAFVVENCGYPGGTPNVTISGGYFESTNADAVASYAYGTENKPIKKFITGGTFSSNPTAFVADGHEATFNGSSWTVLKNN